MCPLGLNTLFPTATCTYLVPGYLDTLIKPAGYRNSRSPRARALAIPCQLWRWPCVRQTLAFSLCEHKTFAIASRSFLSYLLTSTSTPSLASLSLFFSVFKKCRRKKASHEQQTNVIAGPTHHGVTRFQLSQPGCGPGR